MAAKLRSKTRTRAFATSDMVVKRVNPDTGNEDIVSIVPRRKPRTTTHHKPRKIVKVVKIADVLKMRDTRSIEELRRINGV